MKKIFIYSIALLLTLAANLNAYAIETENNEATVKETQEVEETKTSIYDSVMVMDEYTKVKKDGKYGIIDKDGNVILEPVFQRITTIEVNDKECFAVKIDGKFKFYNTKGEIIPDNELYDVTQSTTMLLARDLKPIFKKAAVMKKVTCEKIATETVENNTTYEVPEVPASDNVQIAYIERTKLEDIKSQEVIAQTETEIDEKAENNPFTLGKKQFYIFKEGGKVGVLDSKNRVVIPAKYDSLEVKTPCKHFKTPVFIVSKDDAYTIYNIKGKIIAEQVYDKINVYKFASVYTYNEENNIGILTRKNKQLGVFEKEDEEYIYTPTKFSLFNSHIVNTLVTTILTISKL